MMLRIAYVCWVLLGTVPLIAQDGLSGLPSLNYWEATFDIVRNPEFRDALDISPEQVKQIALMRSREDLGKIIVATSTELAANAKGFTNKHEEFFAVDDLIRGELSAILLPEQFERIKLTKMRFRFKTGFAPFGDPEIRGLMTLSKKEQFYFAERAKTAVENYQKRLYELIQLRCNNLLNTLPVDAKRQMVRYIGTKNLSHLAPPEDDSIDLIPFPGLKSSTTVHMVTESTELQKVIGLTAKQIEMLNVVGKTNDLRLFSKQSKYRSMSEYADAVLDDSYVKIFDIIGKDKLLLVARYMANAEFESNPIASLSRDSLTDFLKLAPKEIEALREQAKVETERYLASVKELDRETFYELASYLPEPAQNQICALFKDFW